MIAGQRRRALDYAVLSHRFQFAAIIYSPASLAGLSAYRKMLPETFKSRPDGFRETDVEIRESAGVHVCVYIKNKIKIYLREASNRRGTEYLVIAPRNDERPLKNNAAH